MQNVPRPNRFMKLMYSIGLGPLVGRMVLLLTTTGRRTGLPRVTPLQYEEVDGTYYVGSMKGTRSDWFRNLTADPNVEIRVKSRKFRATAETITDPTRIADFLELRLRNHPTIVGKILQAEGLPAHPGREQLENYGKRIAVAAIHPQENTRI